MAQLLANIIGTAAGICGMIGFTPQIAKIVREKDASSVSLKMYAITCAGFALWIAYGFLLKSWPVAISNVVNLTLCATILGLKLKYR